MIWAGGHCPLTWSKSWKLMTITLSLTEWTFQQCWILWTLCLSMCEARRKIGGSLWELCLAHTCRLAPAAGEKPMRRKGSRTSSKRLFLSAWRVFWIVSSLFNPGQSQKVFKVWMMVLMLVCWCFWLQKGTLNLAEGCTWLHSTEASDLPAGTPQHSQIPT